MMCFIDLMGSYQENNYYNYYCLKCYYDQKYTIPVLFRFQNFKVPNSKYAKYLVKILTESPIILTLLSNFDLPPLFDSKMSERLTKDWVERTMMSSNQPIRNKYGLFCVFKG